MMKVKMTLYVGAALLGLLCSVACSGTATRSGSATNNAQTDSQKNEVIIDSSLSIVEAVGNQDIPENVKAQLCLLDVRYYSLDGKLHQGQLVIHNSLKDDVAGVFDEISGSRFPIAKVIPVSRYNFSDELSMQDNNTSAFNYRTVEGTNVLSNHALGRAIDINPLFNPYIRGEEVDPDGAKYDSEIPGTILRDGVVVRAFKQRGWSWGGDWNSLKDYQHFEKNESQK